MSFLLVPHEVKSDRARIWVGVVDETDPADVSKAFDPAGLRFLCNGIETPIPAPWPPDYRTASGRHNISYQYFDVAGLQQRTDHVLELFNGNDVVAAGSVRTLPVELPFLDDPKGPFTVLLSSCFCVSNASSPAIGNTYFNLRPDDRPDIKILCGDQVYLDAPNKDFAVPHTARGLEDKHFENYRATWTQTGAPFGNNYFLQNGANFFTADDHEFWNNSPNRATIIPDTYFQGGRDTWRRIAGRLLSIFQDTQPITEFNVGPLSFLLADTRVNRGPGKEDFMLPADLGSVDAWVSRLNSAESGAVGVFVIGQPIFADKAGWFSSAFLDKNLANYRQYAELAAILARAERHIVVLTGDVHYGRLARCSLSTNVSLYEIIASPAALVSPLVGGKWDPSPAYFPPFPVGGLVQKGVETDQGYKMSQEHFLTLGFYRDAAGISVRVRTVVISNGGRTPMPLEIAHFSIGANL